MKKLDTVKTKPSLTHSGKMHFKNPFPFARLLVGIFTALLALLLSAHADTTLFTSAFQGNSGATVLTGNADDTVTSGSGTTSLTIHDWTNNAAVKSISGLTVISTPTPAGGFAVTSNGIAANATWQ